MTQEPDFDVAAAHKYFAANCFNRAWDLIEKDNRTAAEDRMMVALNQASLFHWMNRPDCSDRRMSIGYWQASRIQALLGNAPEAQRNGEITLAYSHDLDPFYIGYAHEALARSASLAGDKARAVEHLSRAEAQAAQVAEKADRELLMADLAALRGAL
jgi:hypothetical protein